MNKAQSFNVSDMNTLKCEIRDGRKYYRCPLCDEQPTAHLKRHMTRKHKKHPSLNVYPLFILLIQLRPYLQLLIHNFFNQPYTSNKSGLTVCPICDKGYKYVVKHIVNFHNLEVRMTHFQEKGLFISCQVKEAKLLFRKTEDNLEDLLVQFDKEFLTNSRFQKKSSGKAESKDSNRYRCKIKRFIHLQCAGITKLSTIQNWFLGGFLRLTSQIKI